MPREVETNHQRLARLAAERAAEKDAQRAKVRAERDAAEEARKAQRAEFRIARKGINSGTNMLRQLQLKPARMKKPDFRIMSEQQLAALAAELLRADKYDWAANARPKQLYPEGAKI